MNQADEQVNRPETRAEFDMTAIPPPKGLADRNTPSFAVTDGTQMEVLSTWQRRQPTQIGLGALDLSNGIGWESETFSALFNATLDSASAVPLSRCSVLAPWQPRQVFCTHHQQLRRRGHRSGAGRAPHRLRRRSNASS